MKEKNNVTLIGNKIRKIRELKDIKQEAIAKEIGISPQAYGKMERDETDISINKLIRISTALKIDVTAIFLFDEEAYINELCEGVKNDNNNDFEKDFFKSEIGILKKLISNNNELIERIIKIMERVSVA